MPLGIDNFAVRGVLRALCLTGAALAAVSVHAAGLPTTLGWSELSNTKLAGVCADGGSCTNVIAAWSGATMDTQRNRLLIFGGGHNDYNGNEVYALDLNTATMSRLNNPSTGPFPTACSNSGAMPDGAPTSRHTYNLLTYIPQADRMFLNGGAGYPCGWILRDTWTLNLATMKWQQMNPSGPLPNQNFGNLVAYDPVTAKVYLHDERTLYSYTFETDTYAEVGGTGTSGALISYYMTPAIDTKRHLFVMVGDGEVNAYDISSGAGHVTRQIWNTTGATAIVNEAVPGLAYDPVTDRMLAWDGGNTVYSLNLDTKVWTAIANSGGPAAAQSNGTYGRFAYSAASNAFVVVNASDQNAFSLKLSTAAGSTTPPPVVPPVVVPPPTGGTSSDFATRCAAAGVVKCNGFDAAADLGTGVYPDSNGVVRATIDTSTKASGAGSLKFTLPAAGNANAAGSWHTALGGNYGQNSTFYVQFREKLSPEMLTASIGGGGFKQVIFSYGTATCANVELTTGNLFWRGYPQMYSQCGNDGFDKTLPNGDYLLQTGADYQCHGQDPTSRTPPCGYYHANEWVTYYYKVTIGTWGQANSRVQAWMAYEGGPLKQFIDETNLTLQQNNPGDSSLYDTVWLLPYDTGRTSAQTASAVWYDDLIVSTQPIAAPAVTTKLPSPPTNLTVR